MNAGKLDRTIRLVRQGHAIPDEFGVSRPYEQGNVLPMRAQLLEATQTDTAQGAGAITNTSLKFRLRFIPGVQIGDYLIFQDARYEITGLAEIGRRKWLEISIEQVGAVAFL